MEMHHPTPIFGVALATIVLARKSRIFIVLLVFIRLVAFTRLILRRKEISIAFQEDVN
jgi:hypothetical protein